MNILAVLALLQSLAKQVQALDLRVQKLEAFEARLEKPTSTAPGVIMGGHIDTGYDAGTDVIHPMPVTGFPHPIVPAR